LFWIYIEVRIVFFVGIEWEDASSSTRSIIVSKLCQG